MFARRLLYSLFLLAVLAFVAGYFLGWFEVSKERDASGDTNIRLKVDKDKFDRDATKVIDQAQDLGDKVKEQIKEKREK